MKLSNQTKEKIANKLKSNFEEKNASLITDITNIKNELVYEYNILNYEKVFELETNVTIKQILNLLITDIKFNYTNLSKTENIQFEKQLSKIFTFKYYNTYNDFDTRSLEIDLTDNFSKSDLFIRCECVEIAHNLEFTYDMKKELNKNFFLNNKDLINKYVDLLNTKKDFINVINEYFKCNLTDTKLKEGFPEAYSVYQDLNKVCECDLAEKARSFIV